MSLKELSDNQIKILALKELGCSFDEISDELGIAEKLAIENYHYAKQKFNRTIYDLDSELTEKQKNELATVLNSLKNHLRELKKLDEEELRKTPYNDLVKISKDIAGNRRKRNNSTSILSGQNTKERK